MRLEMYLFSQEMAYLGRVRRSGRSVAGVPAPSQGGLTRCAQTPPSTASSIAGLSVTGPRVSRR